MYGDFKKHRSSSRLFIMFFSVCGKIGGFYLKFFNRKIQTYYMDFLKKTAILNDMASGKIADIDVLFGVKFLSSLLMGAFFMGAAGIFMKAGTFFLCPVFLMSYIPGFFVPDFILRKFLSDRSGKFRKEIPYMIDLLNISTMAGQNIYNSIKIIREKHRGVICDELSRFLKAIDFGMGRIGAYKNFIAGKSPEDFENLLFLLLQAEKFGSPVNEILAQKAKYLRFELAQTSEQKSRRSSILLLFPLVFLILPAFILLIGGPLVFSIGGSFLFNG
jgi:tight adherence protein C